MHVNKKYGEVEQATTYALLDLLRLPSWLCHGDVDVGYQSAPIQNQLFDSKSGYFTV